jgi:NDP-sugar pyrophosphorylase family protein
LILAAGLGTRLRPLTYVRAKAASPVNGQPIVRRVISWLVREGIADLVLNLHYNPASIAAVVGDGADLGSRVRYSWENPVLGSAGGPRHALPLLVDGYEADTILVVNGDTLTDLHLGDMIAAHHSSGALVTMALTRNLRPDMYGGALVERGRITGFTGRGAKTENFHFIGIQVAEARAFARLEDGVPAESVMQLYPELIRDNPAAIGAYVVDAPFSDVGTPAEYLRTSLDLAAREGDHLVGTNGVRVDPSAELRRTAVWDNVQIGPDSRIEECILCDGVELPQGSRYRRCAIVPFTGRPPDEGEAVDGALLIRRF